MNWKAGEAVRLGAAGRGMVVVGVEHGRASCVWIDKVGPHRGTFDADRLTAWSGSVDDEVHPHQTVGGQVEHGG
jgi:uncharacterized protein YodC (DUF2158 family)